MACTNSRHTRVVARVSHGLLPSKGSAAAMLRDLAELVLSWILPSIAARTHLLRTNYERNKVPPPLTHAIRQRSANGDNCWRFYHGWHEYCPIWIRHC